MNSIHSLLSENHPCTVFMAHDLVALNWSDRIQLKLRYAHHHQQPQQQSYYDELDPFPRSVREPSKQPPTGKPVPFGTGKMQKRRCAEQSGDGPTESGERVSCRLGGVTANARYPQIRLP
jgi:hypothetical protein